MWTDLRKYIGDADPETGMCRLAIELYRKAPGDQLQWMAEATDEGFEFLEDISESSLCTLLTPMELFDYVQPQEAADGSHCLNPFVYALLDILFHGKFKVVGYTGRTIEIFDEVFQEAEGNSSIYDPVFLPGFREIRDFMTDDMNLEEGETLADHMAKEQFGNDYTGYFKIDGAGHVLDENWNLYDDSSASYCIIYFDESCNEEDVSTIADLIGYTYITTDNGFIIYGCCFWCYGEEYLLQTELDEWCEDVINLLDDYPPVRNATSKVRKAACALFEKPQSATGYQLIMDLMQTHLSCTEVLL